MNLTLLTSLNDIAMARGEVLVVEDDPELAEIFAFMAASLGLSVVVAHDGALGRAWLEAHPARAVLLDVNVPSLSGIEIARWMDTRPCARQAIIFFITANPHAVEAHHELADFVLIKPVSFEQTRTLMARALAAAPLAS